MTIADTPIAEAVAKAVQGTMNLEARVERAEARASDAENRFNRCQAELETLQALFTVTRNERDHYMRLNTELVTKANSAYRELGDVVNSAAQATPKRNGPSATDAGLKAVAEVLGE